MSAGDGEHPRRLFVYGSLMEGFGNYNAILAGKVRSRRRAWVQGSLFHQCAKGYPALVPGTGRVTGEFLELEGFDRLLEDCDRLEQYFGPGRAENEYERRLTPVELDAGETAAAYVYWYARSDLESAVNPAIPLPAGNWRSYIEESAHSS